jgi:DNA-binding NtrC family response regulator
MSTLPYKKQILIVDDEKDIRNLMEEIFQEEGYQVLTAADGTQGRKQWQKYHPDIVFLDVWMPDMDGVSLLKEMKSQNATAKSSVIMMSGHGTIETAIEATKLGAYDFLEKPLSLAKLLVTAERALEHQQLNEENAQLKTKAAPQLMPIGKSKAMQSLRDTVERVAQYHMPLYIYGEAGVGKHHLAEAIHYTRSPDNHRFKVVNATDLNELCRHASSQALIDLLQSLNHGTLVIADIEQLDAECQKVIEQQLFSENDADTSPLDLRLIALSKLPASDFQNNPNIRSNFRKRLSVMPIEIPPLRSHTEDIPELIDYFVDHLVSQEGLQYRDFSLGAQNRLRQYGWSGNLREMRNVIQRLLILGKANHPVSDEEVVTLLSSSENEASLCPSIDTSQPLKQARESFERAYLIQLLRETGCNITETAKRSGVDRANLYRKFKALNIDSKNP